MRCIVTAGGTVESIDQVRRLTNFSTGNLGTQLANLLASRGHSVVLFRSLSSSVPPPAATVTVAGFDSTADLASRFLEFATDQPLAIFHAAAVSDFCVGLVYQRSEDGSLRAICSSKYSTRLGGLFVELRPTPKLLPGLREWYPNAQIFGWKYEVEGTRKDALDAGWRQLKEARTTGCIVNGPAHGPGFSVLGTHGSVDAAEDITVLLDHLARLLPAPCVGGAVNDCSD